MTPDLSSMDNAVGRLEQLAARAEDVRFMADQDEVTRNAYRAAVIQHFEIVYELCWKSIRRWVLENVGPEEAENPRTRRDLFRTAGRHGLVESPEAWFAYGDARNVTTHTYSEEVAAVVYAQALLLAGDARRLLARLERSHD